MIHRPAPRVAASRAAQIIRPPPDRGQHELPNERPERLHVLRVRDDEQGDEEGDDAGDQLGRAIGAGAGGVDAQLHGDGLARRGGNGGEHRTEVGHRALVGDLERGDDGVGDRIVHLVGEVAQRRREVSALSPDVQRPDLVADGRRRDPCRLADRLVQAGVGDEEVSEHLGPDGDRLRAGELAATAGAQADERRDHPAEQPERHHGDEPTQQPTGQDDAE
jgi:hypothetical protein